MYIYKLSESVKYYISARRMHVVDTQVLLLCLHEAIIHLVSACILSLKDMLLLNKLKNVFTLYNNIFT